MKFAALDARYKEKRKAFSEKRGPQELWSVIDHWPLYVGIGNLARFLANAELLRSTLEVPGDLAEFGSWRGANLLLMAKLMRLYDPWSNKHIHCFDSFQGLTEFAEADGLATDLAGQYRGSEADLMELIDIYELEEIDIHKGVIEKTLPETLAARPELHFSFVYCDTDLYSSTREILYGIHPRLSPGGIFVLDEWNHRLFPGETTAVSEFMSEYGDAYEIKHVHGTRQPSLVLRKRG